MRANFLAMRERIQIFFGRTKALPTCLYKIFRGHFCNLILKWPFFVVMWPLYIGFFAVIDPNNRER